MPSSKDNPNPYGDSRVRLRRPNPSQANAQSIRRHLRRLTQPIQSFENLFTHAKAQDRPTIKVPDDLIKAWLHLLMGLIYSTAEIDVWSMHIHNAENLIKTGMRQVVESLPRHALLDSAAVLPMDIVSMACLNLFKDMTGKFSNISETYSEYLKALVSTQSPHYYYTISC